MSIAYIKTAQNKKTENWYRIVLDLRAKEYYVQAFGEIPFFEYEGHWCWIILCPFDVNDYESAEQMFQSLLDLDKLNLREVLLL